MNNKQQSEYWNGAAGQTWVGAQVHLDEILNPISHFHRRAPVYRARDYVLAFVGGGLRRSSRCKLPEIATAYLDL